MPDVREITQAPKKPILPANTRQEFEQAWNDPELNDEDRGNLAKIRETLAHHYELPEPSHPIADALHAGLGALSYGGGVGRTAMANAIQMNPAVAAAQYLIRGKLPMQEGAIVSAQDLKDALQGHAQPGSEFTGKMGVPDAASAAAQLLGASPQTSKSMGDYANKAAGFGLDVAGDPATWAMGPIDAAMSPGILKTIAETAANPVGKGMSAAGKSWYTGGMKNELQTAAEKYSKDPKAVSDWLWKNRVWGTKGGQMDQIQDLIDPLKVQKQELVKQAMENGAANHFDPASSLESANDYVARMKRATSSPTGEAGALQKLTGWKNSEELLSELAGQPAHDLPTIVDQQNVLHDAAYPSGESALTSSEQEAIRNAYLGRQKGIESAFNKSTPGSGDRLGALNNEISTGVSAKNAIDANKNYFHAMDPIDAGIAGLGGVGYMGHTAGVPEVAGAALLTKKAYDLMNTPLGRSGGGLVLDALGRVVPQSADVLYDQTSEDPNKNPWRIR